MKDLFFINDCNPTKIEQDLLNFEKFRMLNEIVKMVDYVRKIPYNHILQVFFSFSFSTLHLNNLI